MPTQAELEKYADILLQIGLNVQPNQPVSINAPIEAAEFVRILASRAYDAGAASIDVEWEDPLITKVKLYKEPEEHLVKVPRWLIQKRQEKCDTNTAFLQFAADDPDLLSDVNPQRISMFRTAMGKAARDVQKYFMEDRVTWLVGSLPTTNWARKMFPDSEPDTAMDKLWHAIFKVMRMHTDNPVTAWKDHVQRLNDRARWLDSLKLRQLHYVAPGTDLTVDLPEFHTWVGASSTNLTHTEFVPNLPTEEVFTLPYRNGVNGVVRSTMPLAYSGVVIEEIEFTFENGRIVDFSAASGYETLKGLVETDEGSHYLGEIALVPVDSPISNLNTLFYNTLFDENASCHMALGMAYPTCLQGGRDMSEEELKRHGANDSITHVDFMIGSAELDIDGVQADGTIIPIFRNGNWA